jgi:carboxyl-terminal processing protease
MLRLPVCLLVAALFLRAADEIEAQMKSIIQAYSILEQNAADPVSSEQAFYQGAIPGLLRHLDPHSVFFDPSQFEQLKRMETSTQKGFGSVVSLLPGRVIVLQTLAGTPSAKSGLMPGDEIVAVNGYEIARLDTEQITQLLSQSRQGQAELAVRRGDSPRLLRFVLTPEELQSPSVDRAFFLGAGIGYIRVTSFDGQTAGELKQAIEKLGGDKLLGLVLDFRNNPGGMVTSALEMASLFLPPESKIVTVRGRHVPEKSEGVPSISIPYKFKLAILMNEKTASASEIVAGAMQDHDRATIIGVESFGKGLVQSVFPMSENTGLALTTAMYYTPSGRSIQKPLDASKFELGGATKNPNAKSEFRTDKGRIVRGGGGIEPDLVVFPLQMTRLRAVLDASGSFKSFATEFLRSHKVADDFEVTPQLLGEFQVFLSGRRIQPGVAEWTGERDFLTNRLKTEIFNQAFGVEKGDEVEAQRDPVIQKAMEVVIQQ